MRTKLDSRGTVLMETLMVIPLFIAFLSGIYLLGDLALGRSRLNAADRFAVWLSGCPVAPRSYGPDPRQTPVPQSLPPTHLWPWPIPYDYP